MGQASNQFVKAVEDGREPPAAFNAFTKAQAAGIMPGDPDYPPGPTAPRGPQHDDHRAAIDVGKIIARLQRILDDGSETSHILGAAKILLDKSLPTLNSIEQTAKQEEETPEQLDAKLRLLISRVDAPTLTRILGERARELRETLAKDDSEPETKVA